MAATQPPVELRDVFGVFNNKGGVGKTTLSFNIICEFAAKHLDEVIVVMDVCPQANLSQQVLTKATLTHRTHGDAKVKARADELDTSNLPRTIAGVLGGCRQMGWLAATNVKENFLIHAQSENPNVPGNIFLLCGDAALDTLAGRLATAAESPAVLGDPFYDVHTCLSKLFDKLPGEFGKNVYGFVDTNPALTIYTHMALVASTKLILPLLPDQFSAVAVNEVFSRVYATTGVKQNALANMVEQSFEHKIKTARYSEGPFKIDLPKIHMVIMNKTPLPGKAEAHYSNPAFQQAKAMMGDEGFFGQCFKKSPESFSERGIPIDPSTDWGNAQDPFMTNYLFFMSDLQQAATLSSLGGVPIGALRAQVQLKEKLKAEVEGRGCSSTMLGTAKLFLEYIVKHMTEDRPEMPRNAPGNIKHHLVPQQVAFGHVQANGDSGDDGDDDDDWTPDSEDEGDGDDDGGACAAPARPARRSARGATPASSGKKRRARPTSSVKQLNKKRRG